VYPLSVGFGFKGVIDDTIVMSKVVVPLPVFPMESVYVENAHRFLVKVEMDAEWIWAAIGRRNMTHASPQSY
jgi:hypothetical protein